MNHKRPLLHYDIKYRDNFQLISYGKCFTFVLGMPLNRCHNNLNKSDYKQYYLHFVIFVVLTLRSTSIFSLRCLLATATMDPRRYFYNPIFVVLISFFSRTLLTSLFSHSFFLSFFFLTVCWHDSVTSVSNLKISCLCVVLWHVLHFK